MKKKKVYKQLEIRFDEPKKEVVSVVTEQEHGMTISIKDLPECKHKANLMNIVSNAGSKICVVAMMLPNGKWQAYAGFPDLRDLKYILNWDILSVLEWSCEFIRSAEQVKMLGEVLPSEAAGKLFPNWDVKLYEEQAKERR